VTISNRLTLYIGWITSIISAPQPFPTPLKAFSRDFFDLFHTVYEVYLPYSLTLIFFVHTPPSTNMPHTHCTYFTSCLSLLIFKLMFQGVFQCVPTVSLLHFAPFNPFHCSPLAFQQFSPENYHTKYPMKMFSYENRYLRSYTSHNYLIQVKTQRNSTVQHRTIQ
jgi:hypothetical protein